MAQSKAYICTIDPRKPLLLGFKGYRIIQPPTPPWLLQESGTLGVEVDGVTYTVLTQATTKNSWRITVGGAVDAQITGRIKRRGKELDVVMEHIVSPQKQAGAGTRALKVWCKVLRSLGVRTWVAESVGPEGEAFLLASERRGLLAIGGGSGDDWVIRCR